MRYYQLFEYNSSQTLNNFREPLESRLQTDSRAKAVLGTEPTPEAALAHLEAIDPSKKKAFVLNLLNWYIDGSMRFIEDAYKAKEVLPLYMKFKNRDGVPHISKLSFSDFLELGDRLGETKSNTEIDKEKELVFYESGQAELISDTPEWKVIIPKTKEAAIYFGKNTKWCTSAVNNNMFDSHNKYGPLYIILYKKENKRYQLHFQTKQYMNERDKPASIPELKEMFNGPMKKFQKIAVKNDGMVIKYINSPSEEMLLLAVQQDGHAIKHIENPSEELQRLAVQQNNNVIQFIKNPSEELQKMVVEKNPFLVLRINNPSLKILNMAINNDPSIMKHYDDLSSVLPEEALMDIIRKDGKNIIYVNNPPEDLQIQALKQNVGLYFINNPTEQVRRLAVKENCYAIKYIDNPSEEIQKLAVEQDPSVIRYIKNPSEEVQKLATQQILHKMKEGSILP